MMRAYTVRCAPGGGIDPPWAWEVFNRNGWMHVACTISFWSTILVTVLPGVKDAFHVTNISFPAYCISIAWAVLNAILDEIVPKPLYKRKLRRERAAALARGEKPLPQNKV